MMAQCAAENFAGEFDAVTWVPVSKKRLKKRGFDQAELLARTAGRALDLPAAALLRKCRHTQPQSGLEEESARRANALGAYELLPGGKLEGKRVLLVDDVVTSGATLSECGRVLLQGGAAAVYCLTLAQARRE